MHTSNTNMHFYVTYHTAHKRWNMLLHIRYIVPAYAQKRLVGLRLPVRRECMMQQGTHAASIWAWEAEQHENQALNDIPRVE